MGVKISPFNDNHENDTSKRERDRDQGIFENEHFSAIRDVQRCQFRKTKTPASSASMTHLRSFKLLHL